MRIYGIRKGTHYFVNATFISEPHHILKYLNFMVDSGASVTTICADRLNIDKNTLPDGHEMITANGPSIPKVLNDPLLIFSTSRRKLIVETLDFVDLCDIPHASFDGLLGMDIQNRFKIAYGVGRTKILFEK